MIKAHEALALSYDSEARFMMTIEAAIKAAIESEKTEIVVRHPSWSVRDRASQALERIGYDTWLDDTYDETDTDGNVPRLHIRWTYARDPNA